ncbi:MAG: DUF4174 domain-containing protein [Bradymonadia bacterium]
MHTPLISRFVVALLVAVSLLACSSKQRPQPVPEIPFHESFKGERRLLVVFDAAPGEALEAQRQLIKAEKPRWRDADLLLLEVVEGQPIVLAGQKMQVPQGADLRTALHAPSGRFTAVLVGLDGTEKLREDAPISVETLITADPLARQDTP